MRELCTQPRGVADKMNVVPPETYMRSSCIMYASLPGVQKQTFAHNNNRMRAFFAPLAQACPHSRCVTPLYLARVVIPIMVRQTVAIYARIRPGRGGGSEAAIPQLFSPTATQLQAPSGAVFTFNRVFDDNASQEAVYSTVVAPLVTKFCAGINCTLLAYGQTGSGKVHILPTTRCMQHRTARCASHTVQHLTSWRVCVRLADVDHLGWRQVCKPRRHSSCCGRHFYCSEAQCFRRSQHGQRYCGH